MIDDSHEKHRRTVKGMSEIENMSPICCGADMACSVG